MSSLLSGLVRAALGLRRAPSRPVPARPARLATKPQALPATPSPAPVVGQATPSIVTLPNAITVGGYAASIAWLAGGSPWLGVLGLVADELDGRVARATGQTSELGSLLDWGTDLTLTGLTAERAGLLWTLPAVTPAQVYMREKGQRPIVGSARAIFTLIALWKDASRRRKAP